MKTKPILFSTEMVKANLAGRKNKTRRIVDEKHYGFLEYAFSNKSNLADWISKNAEHKIGDILWVRETFEIFPVENASVFNNESSVVNHYQYKADQTECFIKWKPSIHMPKEAARMFLKILNVRVERLQDISKEDCINEGILPLNMSSGQLEEMGQVYFDYSKPKRLFNDGLDPLNSFKSLWESINGKGSWNENPFVWVYEYKIIEKPENFRS